MDNEEEDEGDVFSEMTAGDVILESGGDVMACANDMGCSSSS